MAELAASQPTVITHRSQLESGLETIDVMPEPGQALMVKPDYFSVDYVINPHMENNIGKVDLEKAYREWETVRDTFRQAGITVHEIDAQPGVPDMVFAANQALPFISDTGRKETIMSIMHSDHRKNEVPFLEQWYRQNGYTIHHLDYKTSGTFEGMGDALWHHGRKLLWGGYGFRTSAAAYESVSSVFSVPVIALELKNPAFYHLDTCMCILDEDSVLIYSGAFTEEGLNLIRSVFKNIVEADETEALHNFACNAAPAGRHVIIQKGSTKVVNQLDELGFTVHEVETGEFIKSGGSVFCMKCMIW